MNYAENVGQTWQSPDGLRTVLRYHEPQAKLPGGGYEVGTEGRSSFFNEIIPPERLDKIRQVEESNVAYRAKAAAQELVRKQAEADEYARYKGFLETFTPMKSGKIRTALEKQSGFDGQVMSRKAFIIQAVQDGATVGETRYGKSLMMPSGGYFTANQITASAIDFAAHLIAVNAAFIEKVADGLNSPEFAQSMAAAKEDVRSMYSHLIADPSTLTLPLSASPMNTQTNPELNPLAFAHNGVNVYHVRKDSDDRHSRITNYWFKIGTANEETDVRTLPTYKEPVYCAKDEIGEYPRKIAAEAERAICLYIDGLPPVEPVTPTIPVVQQVETLLRFIEENASEAVFQKAQELETVLTGDFQSVEYDRDEAKRELEELEEELTNGHKLGNYAAELKNFHVCDFIDEVLSHTKMVDCIEHEWKDRLFQPETHYLAIEASADIMDEILAPQLAELISRLGIEEALHRLSRD